ncbi:MAG: CBS domain-containing protein [Candidatus Aenigmatarchaeota archaeon]|nr:CBS domain-containing protein [Candidatus Aenigmarchaeota archaeon]
MKVSSVMTRKVVFLRPTDSLHDAVGKLVKNDISSLPVINNKGKLVGLVTEGDIIRTIDAYTPKIHFDTESSFAVVLAVLKKRPFDAIKKEIINSGKLRVSDFMNRSPHTIKPDADIYDAARLMNRHRVKMLPVIDENKKVVGVIARADIIRALSK